MNGRTSEGHTSAVTVLRMVGTRHEHQAAEPVPFRAKPSGAPLRSIKPPRACEHKAPQGCTHDCDQGRRCTCAPLNPSESRSLLAWLAALLVFCLMAGAMALMGAPHDH